MIKAILDNEILNYILKTESNKRIRKYMVIK